MIGDVIIQEEAKRILSVNTSTKYSKLLKARLLQAGLISDNFTLRITEQVSAENLVSHPDYNDFILISTILQNKLRLTDQVLFLDFEDSHLITE